MVGGAGECGTVVGVAREYGSVVGVARTPLESVCRRQRGGKSLVAVGRSSDPLGGIDDIGRVAKVEHELLRLVDVPLDLLAAGELQSGIPLRLKLRDRGSQ